MANRFAVANGNFHDTSTWSTTPSGSGGASVPTVGDVAYANGRIVTIDSANVSAYELSNTNSSSATAGGRFEISVDNIRIDCLYLRSGTASAPSPCVVYSGTGTLTFGACTVFGGGITNNYTIALSGSGSIIFESAVLTPLAQSGSYCVRNIGAGSILFNVALIESDSVSGGAIVNTSTGYVQIDSGIIYGGGIGIVNNTSSGKIRITSSTISGGTSSNGIAVKNATGEIEVYDSIIAGSNSSVAIDGGTSISAINKLSGVFAHSQTGVCPITGARWFLGNTPTNGFYQASLNGVSTSLVFHQDGSPLSQSGQAQPSDVRINAVYGPTGSLIGTCHVPAAASVAAGVPVDNTVGTAVLTPAAVQAIVGAIVADAIDS